MFQTTTWCLQAKAPLRSRAFVLRLRYCISRAHQVKYSSCSCETFRPLSPSLCMHKLIHKQCWHNPIIHLVLTSRAYFFVTWWFVLSIQILIDLYPLSREEFNNNSSSSHSQYSLIECTHVWHLWCRPNVALMSTSTNNPLFSSNSTTWLTDVHPTWSDDNSLLNCYTPFHFICNSAICSRVWDDM